MNRSNPFSVLKHAARVACAALAVGASLCPVPVFSAATAVDLPTKQLPPRRRASTWPLKAGVRAGAVLCSLSVFTSPLWRPAWHGWLAGHGSPSTLVMLSAMAAMSLLALGWTLAEADDH